MTSFRMNIEDIAPLAAMEGSVTNIRSLSSRLDSSIN
jgi:hypothetical protein